MIPPFQPTFPNRHPHMRTSRLAPLIFPALLLAAAPCDAQQRETSRSRTVTSSERTVLRGDMIGVFSTNGKSEHVWIETEKGIDVRAGGEIVLREDGAEVESIPPGGYLTVQQRLGSATHRAEWHPAAGGGVARSYTVNGERRAFAEARPWLDRFFPEVMSTTSIGARARFARVLARRGVSGVLDEAAAAESGATRQVFLEGLAERDLSPAETQRFIQALGGISSGSTRRDLLLKTSARRPLTADQWTAWLAAASTLSSGSDRRELLNGAVAKYPRGRALPDGFFRALDGISSSSDRREVLTRLLAVRGGEPGTLGGVLASTAKLPSSSDRRDVLQQAAQLAIPAAAVPQYLHVVGGSSSSSDRRDALAALLRNRAALQTGPAAAAWLGEVKRLPSDSDKTTLLMGAIGRLPKDRQTRAAFSEALETVSSDSDYNQIATAYLRSQTERS